MTGIYSRDFLSYYENNISSLTLLNGEQTTFTGNSCFDKLSWDNMNFDMGMSSSSLSWNMPSWNTFSWNIGSIQIPSWDAYSWKDSFKFSTDTKSSTFSISDTPALSASELKSIKGECSLQNGGFSLDSQKLQKLYDSMGLGAKGLNFEVFKSAIQGYNNLKDKGSGMLGIFDTTQGNNSERYYLIDLKNLKVVGQTAIRTGSGNMGNVQTANRAGSHATLSGFEKVGVEYRSGKDWKWGIRLHGLEPGINDNAYKKSAVAHYTPRNSTWGCKGITPVMKNGKIDENASREKLHKFFPKGAIIYTHPTDKRYWSLSKLYS